MKQNLVVLLADIFNLFEIHPAACVDYPESEQASGESLSHAIKNCLNSASNMYKGKFIPAKNLFDP